VSEPQLRLLVVDDDPTHLELVERVLSRDFDVRCAVTQADLEREATKFAPELLLVDMNMPDLPSDRAIALARAAAPAIRVYIYSAWDDAKLRSRCHELGADGYLSKSVSVMEMGGRLMALHRTVKASR
jgi:DNA-binding NarL/FixJ family response regulator